MKAKEFQDKVQEAYLKCFPNGYFRASQLCLGGGVCFAGGLIANARELTGTIRQNDPLSISIFIHKGIKFNDTDNDLGDLEIEFDNSHISVIPDNPMYYSQSHKIRTRKIKGSPEKAIDALSKYFNRVLVEVKEQASLNRIIRQDTIDLKYL